MAAISDYGTVYTSDVLVIGGGMAGLVTAIKAKQDNPALDILVIDKGSIGWAGQSTKAGNGIRCTAKGEDAVMKAVDYLVHTHTEFMNDQEALAAYLEEHRDNIDYMNELGVKVSVDEEGKVATFDFVPGALEMAGIQINTCQSLRSAALKLGVRLYSRVNAFELLTSVSGRVVGAIGFDMDKGACRIFQAKAVALATQGCHFKKIGLEFMGYGTGIGAAYRVGAVTRNNEFSTQTDIVFKKNNTPIYGGFNILYNQKGENIKDKYCGKEPLWELSTELVLGMLEEIKAGNGPIWCDLEHPDIVRKIIGGQDHSSAMRMLRDKMAWEHHVFEKTERSFGDVGLRPETTIKMVLQVETMKVDERYRTGVEGLWATGKMVCNGTAYFGWTRGDGVGYASTTGRTAGRDIAAYCRTATLELPRAEQVKALKDKIYAPLGRVGKYKPKAIFDAIETYIFDAHRLLIKSEETIHACLDDIERMKRMLPELTADDPHTLAKCLEAADNVLCLEMVYRSADMRKESRGQAYPHYRSDYPQHDDRNWLKWINCRQGKDGEMELFTEDIPLWRYPVRPEGYAIPEGHAEEYYVGDRAKG